MFGLMSINLVLLSILCCSFSAIAQTPSKSVSDSSFRQPLLKPISIDSIGSLLDSTKSGAKKLAIYKKNEVVNRIKQFGDTPSVYKKYKSKLRIPSSYKNSLSDPFKDLVTTKPWIKFSDGYTSYQFTYRSNIDTPYVEKDINQHNLVARLNLMIGGIAPISVIYSGRRSNSGQFKDINDVQVSFNAGEFANNLQSSIRNRLTKLAPQLNDSITGQLLNLKRNRQLELDKWLNSSFQLQNLVEANETLKVPKITYDPNLSDSMNAKREDSLKMMAKAFMDLYETTKEEYDKIRTQVDSLEKIYNQSLLKLKRFQQLISGQGQELINYGKWKNKLTEFGFENIKLPAKYRWLLGVRKFSLGRSVINQSELTAKNISVNGINFEYNSWYYLAVTAGLIDYRFRDFVVGPFKKSTQYLYILRLGLGRLEGNHFIVSGFQGQKQLFTGSTNRGGLSSITVKGLSVEGRFNINKTTYLTAELAESISPDFRNTPAGESTKLGFSDKTNNAYAVRFFSYLPITGSRIEAMYKYSGANYQSFTSFQTNAGQEAWFVKADQQFFKKQLRISAALRSAEFFNPFIVQQYKNNTIFKSVSATFRKKKWPILSVGYIPMSQITKLDNQLFETRFQTLNASYYQLYKINKTRAATSLIYNRFYNSSSDTGFLYYNAINVYGAQNFYFRLFSTGVGASYTKNNSYKLLVMEENVNWNFLQWGTIGFGVKVNKYGEDEIKLGAYVNANMRIGKADMLSFSVEKGYLPGFSGGLVKNEIASIQYAKAFRFK